MIELLKGRLGALKAIVLAGILLSCVSHLEAAQRRVSLILEPPDPEVGQDVTLVVRGGPRQLVECEWFRETHDRGDPERILEYFPSSSPQQRNHTAHSGRETVRADCSLRIANLQLSDTGNYSIILEGDPVQHQTGQQQNEVYEGTVYLEVSAPTQIHIRVLTEPQHPNPGGEVKLTPQEAPGDVVFCEWLKQRPFGDAQTIIQFNPKEQKTPQGGDAGGHERVTAGPDCSLRMTRLTTADSGTYTVKMEVLLDRRQQKPGQGTRPQEPGGIQQYWGEVELQVNQASGTDQQKGQSSKSTSWSYSAGVVVGALLGFFAWTDTFAALSHVLCCASPI